MGGGEWGWGFPHLCIQHQITDYVFPFCQVTTSGETSIPSSASIELPPIQVIADYRQAKSEPNVASQSSRMEEGLQLREGSYLNAMAEVGMLEHSLTTDLLNHLVFVQKVFMKVSLATFFFLSF